MRRCQICDWDRLDVFFTKDGHKEVCDYCWEGDPDIVSPVSWPEKVAIVILVAIFLYAVWLMKTAHGR